MKTARHGSLPTMFCCAFAATFAYSGLAADVSWTGETDADWATASNWDGGVPQAGDSVTIPSGVANMPILAASTPALDSITISGTLTFTNWTTCLNATTVTVASGGTLTCAGPFTDTEMSNRVWVVCTDFTLASGGKIDVNYKGFSNGSGPGKAYGNNTVWLGAAHGGWGGWQNANTDVQARMAYDSASEPVMPGSGGIGGLFHGGGVVRIDATGTVAVDGAISANGSDIGNAKTRAPGAGGSILVVCNRFVSSSSAEVKAVGGNVTGRTYPAYRVGGGGGRIAICYNASAQQTGDIDGTLFSAAAGYENVVYNSANPGTTRYPSARYTNVMLGEAQNGTLWFTDEKAYGENFSNLGTCFEGRLANVSTLAVDGDLTITKRLGFANPGVSLAVSGNLTVSGTGAVFAFGETEASSSLARKTACGASPVALTVGGDFALTGGARADIHAGMTNGTGVAGADISVGGAFSVGENSTVYLYTHPSNGGAPRITAASCTIAEGALVSADTFGFESVVGSKNAGRGPGAGTSNSGGAGTGASYGGLGGGASEGKTYGDAIYPTLPGSSGGTGNAFGSNILHSLAGGGLVHIKTTGAFSLLGAISANGSLYGATSSDSGYRFGGGSGGAILLECKKLTTGESTSLSANGGSASATYTRGGGGGRISVITGAEYTSETKSSRLTVSEAMPSSYLGSVSVAGGAADATNGVAGSDGTIRFVTVASGSGMMIFVR